MVHLACFEEFKLWVTFFKREVLPQALETTPSQKKFQAEAFKVDEELKPSSTAIDFDVETGEGGHVDRLKKQILRTVRWFPR